MSLYINIDIVFSNINAKDFWILKLRNELKFKSFDGPS